MKNTFEGIGVPMTAQELQREVKSKIKIGEEYRIKYKIQSGSHEYVTQSEKSRCVALYPHHVRFINKNNINICLTYFEVYTMLMGQVINDKYFLVYRKSKKGRKI